MTDKFLTHLEGQRSKIRKQIAKLQDEMEKLDYSERQYRASGAVSEAPNITRPAPTISDLLGPKPEYLQHAPSRQPPTLSIFPGVGKTIKERVLLLLESNPGGLTSSQILNNLNIDGGQPVSRESLSPQLSRLRNADRKIDLDQGVWSLLKHETPGA